MMQAANSLPFRLSKMDKEEFVALLGGIYEHSPWVASVAWHSGPFSTLHELHDAMQKAVASAGFEQKLALIRSHPVLGNAKLGSLSPSSQSEQRGAKLDELSPEESAELQRLNLAYQRRFDFPFIVAVAGKSRQEILVAMIERLENSLEQEFDRSLQEIGQIANLRLQQLNAVEPHVSTSTRA